MVSETLSLLSSVVCVQRLSVSCLGLTVDYPSHGRPVNYFILSTGFLSTEVSKESAGIQEG